MSSLIEDPNLHIFIVTLFSPFISFANYTPFRNFLPVLALSRKSIFIDQIMIYQ